MSTSSLRGNAHELDAQDATDSYSTRKDSQHGPNNPVRKSKKKPKHRFPGYKHCDPVDQPIRRHTRHEFGAKLKFQAPNPLDMAYWKALTLVNDVQSPYERFASPLCLKALNCAPTVFYEGETAPVVHALFQRCRTIKVQIKLVRDAGSDSAWGSATVMLRDGERWIPFTDYLKALDPLCENEEAASGDAGYALQFKWWKSMGKPFRFYDLPPELRETILFYTLGRMVQPRVPEPRYDPWSEVNVTVGSPARHWEWTWDFEPFYPKVPPTNLSILRLNKDLAEVTRNLLWHKTTKVFSHLETFIAVCRPVIPKQFSWLNRMHLCLEPLALVHMFQVEIAPFDAHYHQRFLQNRAYWEPHATEQTGSVPAGCFLRSLPSLNFLELEIPASHESSAWYTYYRRRATPPNEISLWTAMGMEFCAAPCQERFMNHVMCFAAEYLQNVKIVCLTGAIKTCVKTKWEDLLNNNVYRNIKPKIDEWKEEIRNLPVHELPPRCFCPETCSHSLGNLDVDDSGPDRPMIFEGMAWDYHGFRIPYEQ